MISYISMLIELSGFAHNCIPTQGYDPLCKVQRKGSNSFGNVKFWFSYFSSVSTEIENDCFS